MAVMTAGSAVAAIFSALPPSAHPDTRSFSNCTSLGDAVPGASLIAGLFPDLSLPSYELCGNEIGFNFDLGSVGAEVCWDV